MEKRYIGIDLHRNRFTCCIRLENERTYVTEWVLEDLGRFVKKLRCSDEVAVEITGNTRLFHGAVATHVKRVVSVNPNRLQVVTRWVKKPDPNDATGAQVAKPHTDATISRESRKLQGYKNLTSLTGLGGLTHINRS